MFSSIWHKANKNNFVERLFCVSLTNTEDLPGSIFTNKLSVIQGWRGEVTRKLSCINHPN